MSIEIRLEDVLALARSLADVEPGDDPIGQATVRSGTGPSIQVALDSCDSSARDFAAGARTFVSALPRQLGGTASIFATTDAQMAELFAALRSRGDGHFSKMAAS